jgi:hypothetical protein
MKWRLYEILCTEGISACETIVPVLARSLTEALVQLRREGFVPTDPDVREIRWTR